MSPDELHVPEIMPWGGVKIMLEFTGSSIMQTFYYLIVNVCGCTCTFKLESYVSCSVYFLDYLEVNFV